MKNVVTTAVRRTEMAGSLATGFGVLLAALPGLAHAQGGTDLSGVVVAGQSSPYGAQKSALTKLTAALVDTPQSITAISRQELDDRAVSTIDDAVRTSPGISLGAGEYSFQGSNVFIRGFTSRNDMFLDGQRDYGYYNRDVFNAETVEVLRGSSSILFGRGSTGGVINQSSKTPSMAGAFGATAALGTADFRRGTIDLNTPLAAIGDTVALRVNVMGQDSGVSGRDGAHAKRWGLAPTIAAGLGTDTRLLASYFHQSERNRPDYGIPWFGGRPVAVARNNFYGFSADYFNADIDISTLTAEHDFSDRSIVRSQLRHSSIARDFRISEAQIPAGTALTTPLANITVHRFEFQGSSRDRFLQSQTDWRVTLGEGPVRHEVVSGIELGREKAAPDYVNHVGVPGTNLATPNTAQAYSFTQRYPRLQARTTANSSAAYFMDTISFGEHWQAIVGARADRFSAHYRSTGYTATGAVSAVTAIHRVDQAVSWRGALIYKPTQSMSVYATGGTSFNPSAEGIESLISSGRALTQSNLNLSPEKGVNLEGGFKTSAFGDRALLSVAAFQLEKRNVRVPDPSIPGFNTLAGKQSVRGLEAEIVGQITQALDLRANYTLLDSETTASTTGGPLVGRPLTVTPKHAATVSSSYAVNPKLNLGVAMRYVGARLGQNTAASYQRAPGYTVFDAMAEYRATDAISLKLNLSNLGDKTYFDALHPFHVVPGAGRMAVLSLVYRGR